MVSALAAHRHAQLPCTDASLHSHIFSLCEKAFVLPLQQNAAYIAPLKENVVCIALLEQNAVYIVPLEQNATSLPVV